VYVNFFLIRYLSELAGHKHNSSRCRRIDRQPLYLPSVFAGKSLRTAGVCAGQRSSWPKPRRDDARRGGAGAGLLGLRRAFTKGGRRQAVLLHDGRRQAVLLRLPPPRTVATGVTCLLRDPDRERAGSITGLLPDPERVGGVTGPVPGQNASAASKLPFPIYIENTESSRAKARSQVTQGSRPPALQYQKKSTPP
jgi:hypothetical protein